MLFESSFARGPLGFTLLEGTLEVVSVEPGSCAEQGGVRAFQRVMAVDGVAVSSHEGFLQQLGANARSHVRVRFRSNERPADASVASTGAGAGAGDDVRAPHAETSITWGDAAESKGGAKTRPLSKAADAVFFKGAEAPNWPLAKCRDAWSAEEDAKLMELLGGPSKIRWSTVASLLPGARRTGKQARERWHNQLNPETASKVRRDRACARAARAPFFCGCLTRAALRAQIPWTEAEDSVILYEIANLKGANAVANNRVANVSWAKVRRSALSLLHSARLDAPAVRSRRADRAAAPGPLG